MDIVVTIPKSEYLNDDKESKHMKEEDLVQFWTLNRSPKNISVGDRVYFVKNGEIESSMEIMEIEKDSSMTCLTTDRTWTGSCQLVLDDLQDEHHLGIHVKGFQGFRYRWW
ncbi:hypothetical protein CVD28_00735 [Bacillus sp. M6-12]|uniref:hypothetical protein n=1 Tax=Bacillus sp. M6-12 TaxID=2054166 RepID=UPI000C792A37|nr:hypothetical protein [Bacillus sp. M6-12]PLS18959.1 hypothetical protein CVD28_00735 [Bacillus sp. M6-12]